MMGIVFETLEEAKANPDGMKLVVVKGIPSPWSEAAKGLLQRADLPFAAVHLDPMNPDFVRWAGSASAPVLLCAGQEPMLHWSEILTHLHRLAPTAGLLPENASDRALCVGLVHELCGPDGLGWNRRLMGIDAGLCGQEGGFPKAMAAYLAKKYGYQKDLAAKAKDRVSALLRMLAKRLKEQRSRDHAYFVGSSLTAADIYSAAFMALFAPLPESSCAMNPAVRAVFESIDEQTRQALDPILLEHRDRIYQQYLPLPLRL